MGIWIFLGIALLAVLAVAAISDLRDRKAGRRTRLKMPRGQARRRESRAMRNGLAIPHDREGLREAAPRE